MPLRLFAMLPRQTQIEVRRDLGDQSLPQPLPDTWSGQELGHNLMQHEAESFGRSLRQVRMAGPVEQQRLVDIVETILEGDPQPELVVDSQRDRFVEQADIVEHLASNNRRRKRGDRPPKGLL